MEPEKTTNDDTLGGTDTALRDLLLEARGLFLAVLTYKVIGKQSALNSVSDAYASTVSTARIILFSYLTSRQPQQRKGLKEVDRCFEAWSVAGRDLLFAVLRFLRR